MLSYRELFHLPRRAARSYGELLPWFGMATDALVLCQDGSLLAGFSLAGEDVEGRERAETDLRIHQLELALRTLNDRCTLWSIRDRRFTQGYPEGQFTSPMAAAIDRHWQASCSRTRQALIRQRVFIAYRFPNRSEAFFEALRTEMESHEGSVFQALGELMRRRISEKGAIAQVRGQLADMAHEFEKVLSAFSGIVERLLGFQRLRGSEFLGELYGRANLASTPGPVAVSPDLCYLAPALASDSVERQHDQFRFVGPSRSTCVAALSMTATPPHAYSEQIDSLLGLDCEYVLVQCFRFLDRLTAEREIQNAEMFYRSEVKSVLTRVAERLFDMESEKINSGQLHLAQDAQEALVELTAGDVQYGWYNFTVLPMGESPREVEAAVDLVSSALRANGFTVVRERHGLLPAILTSLPGHADATLRWKLVSTGNLADLAPMRTVSRGEPTHPLFSRLFGHPVPPLCRFATPHGIPFDFNPHEGDLGHTVVVGGSGAGKTALMGLLISQFQKYTPSRTYVFDKDHSLMVLSLLLDGRHVDLGDRQRPVPMNPVLTMLRNGDDARLRQWLELLIRTEGHPLSPGESTTLNSAIQALRVSPESQWRLSAIHALVAGQDQALAHKLASYVDLSDELDAWRTGSHAHYFDNAEDAFNLTPLIALECGGLLDDDRVASPFMDYAFYCIERSLDGETPTLIYIEEAWYMLRNPAFVARLEDWLRTFRKKRAFVMLATQSVDELARLPEIGSFIANIPTQIYLPSVRNAVQQQAAQYRDVFGVNDAQLDLLAQAVPRRDYLLVRAGVTRLVHASMPAVLVAINEATTQPARRAAAVEYAARGGPDWALHYLREVLNVAC